MKKFSVKPRSKLKGEFTIGSRSGSSRSWIFLGRLAETGTLTNIKFDSAHPHVISIVGKRGSGKSYTMGSFLEGLCTKSLSTSISSIDRSQAVLLFDTLGIFKWTNIRLSEASGSKVLDEQKDVWRGWDIGDEALDVTVWFPKGLEGEVELRGQRSFSIRTTSLDSADWGYLLGLDIYQDRMGQLLNDAHIKVTKEGWKTERRTRPPKSEYSISDLLDCITNDTELNTSYQSETRRAVVQQLKTFERNPLFQKQGTSLRDLLKPGQMSVFVMNRMSGPLRLVVMSALIRQILAERVRAADIEKTLLLGAYVDQAQRIKLEKMAENLIPPCWVAIDEAQNVLPSERKNPAGEILVRFVREGRNYGLSFMVATQQPTAIDARIMAQVDTLITHRLAVQGDIDYVRRNLKANLPEEVRHGGSLLDLNEVLRALDVGQALISNSDADRSYFLDIRPRITAHGGF